MDTHLIFYVDLLGVQAAIDESTDERVTALSKLLHEMASLRGAFSVEEEDQQDGWSFTIRPETSTFSDHIVISYKTRGLSQRVEQNILTSALVSAERHLSFLAVEALSLDLLIRGGVALGPLHHENGVVIGKAMVEAYRLESGIANYPRIVMSRELCAELKANIEQSFALTDHDGVAHFNYFRRMMRWNYEGGHAVPTINPEVRDKILENIERLGAAKRWKELAKWEWFKRTLEQVRLALQNASNRLPTVSELTTFK